MPGLGDMDVLQAFYWVKQHFESLHTVSWDRLKIKKYNEKKVSREKKVSVWNEWLVWHATSRCKPKPHKRPPLNKFPKAEVWAQAYQGVEHGDSGAF